MTGDNVGEIVRELRTMRGLSQKELADRLGIERSQVSQIETGHYTPSINVLDTILGALDAHLEVELNEGGIATDTSGLDFPPAQAAL